MPVGESATSIRIVSDAAGRIRFEVPWLRASPGRAVAIEDAVDRVLGVRAAHAYPRTASVVVWISPTRIDRAELIAAIETGCEVEWSDVPERTPRSADVGSAEVLRMAVGGAALVLLGFRRYGLNRPPVLGPTSRLVATGATVFTGYPFLRGALRSLSGNRGAGTDALVSAATVASLVLRENVVALTVLWLLNIGEYLQELTLRRTRRAIADLLNGTQDTAWVRLADGSEVSVDTESLCVGDDVVVHAARERHRVLAPEGEAVHVLVLPLLVHDVPVAQVLHASALSHGIPGGP